jgi:WD40 repeat protein
VGGGFSADGRRIRLILAVPDEARPNAASRWRLVEIDVADGTVHNSGLGGVVPAPVGALGASFLGDSGILTDGTGSVGPVVIDVAGLRSSTPGPPASRPAGSLEFRALPSGAAQFWDDGAVTLFDRAGRPVQELGVHREPVRDAVVSPDGTWAVTAGDGPLVVLWDIDPDTGHWSHREILAGHDGDVLDVALDPSGERLITMSLDGTIITWDMSPDGGFGESYPGLEGRWVSGRPRLIEPSGLLVAPTRPGTSTREAGEGPGPGTESVAAAFIDPATGDVVQQVVVGDTLARAGSGSSVAVSPDGRMVAVTWGLGATVLDTRTRRELARIELPPNGSTLESGERVPATPLWSAGWTPDGGTLLLGTTTGDIVFPTGGYLIAVDTGTWQVREPRVDTGGGQPIVLSPDRRLLAVSSNSAGEVVLLDANSLEEVRRLPLADASAGTDLSFSPDGRFLAAGGDTGGLYVFDTTTWDLATAPAQLHDNALIQVEWLSDGRTVATSGVDGRVFLFDVRRGQLRGRPLGRPGEGYAHLMPGPTDELVVLHGERPGRRYPLDPQDWLDEACTIAGRNLTHTEWQRYLPDRPYERTCP